MDSSIHLLRLEGESRIFCLIVVVCICLFLTSEVKAQKTSVRSAQNADITRQDASLNTRLDLDIGTTKLPQLLEVLSRKAGVEIRCEPYLVEREIIVRMKDVSCHDVLDVLCELHDWTWQRTSAGGCLVSRKPLPIRKSAENVPLFIQNAIPSDMRRFLGAGTTLVTPNRPPQYQYTEADSDQKLRRVLNVSKIISQLIASLDVDKLTQQHLTWDQMSKEQQDNLVAMYVLMAFRQTAYSVLHDDSLKYRLKLENNELFVQYKGIITVAVFYPYQNRRVQGESIAVRVGETDSPPPPPRPQP